MKVREIAKDGGGKHENRECAWKKVVAGRPRAVCSEKKKWFVTRPQNPSCVKTDSEGGGGKKLLGGQGGGFRIRGKVTLQQTR